MPSTLTSSEMPAAFVGNQNKYVPAGVLVTLIAASSSTILRGCGGQKQLIESDKTSIHKSHLQNSGKTSQKKRRRRSRRGEEDYKDDDYEEEQT